MVYTNDPSGKPVAQPPELLISFGLIGVAFHNLENVASSPMESDSPGKQGAADSTPLLSVIIPAFNAESFIASALDNVVAQQISSLEIIVVDDGSTDQTVARAEAHAARPRVVRRANGGPGAARNTGLEAALAPLVTFLDVDDKWPTDSLRRRLDVLLTHPEIRMAMGCVQLEGLDGKALPIKPWAAPNLGAGLYRRDVFTQIGNFEPSLLLDDVDWFWRARDAGIPTAKLEEVTLQYRKHSRSLTASKTWIDLGLAKVIHRAHERSGVDSGSEPAP